MLPQLTDLTLSIGGIVGGAVLVEIIFAYRGIGFLLLSALEANDFTLISGIVFTMILATAFFVLVVDLIYPLLDPRISYAKGAE
jgi:peptide/nickel transport system permease protein